MWFMSSAHELGWYLNEWLDHLDISQADIVRGIGWDKQKISNLCTGRTSYSRKTVDSLAQYMGLHPYELLVSPQYAIRLRCIIISIILHEIQ